MSKLQIALIAIAVVTAILLLGLTTWSVLRNRGRKKEIAKKVRSMTVFFGITSLEPEGNPKDIAPLIEPSLTAANSKILLSMLHIAVESGKWPMRLTKGGYGYNEVFAEIERVSDFLENQEKQ